MASLSSSPSPPTSPSAPSAPYSPSSPSERKRRPKSLLEPTEAMLAARREYEARKSQIKPEDDPFWEKRGGKGERFYRKYPSVVSEKGTQKKDHHGHVVPLSPTSNLLTPTKAVIHGSYHRDKDQEMVGSGSHCGSSKNITPLSPSSHLLTPTKASSLAEYHPTNTSAPSSSSTSNKSTISHTSPLFQSPTLHEMTVNRRASLWEKKPQPIHDPREDGWKNILLTKSSVLDSSEPPVVPVAHHNQLYKDVKSKLYQPTIASSHQMWIHFHDTHHGYGEGDQSTHHDDLIIDDDGIERDISHLLLDEGSEHQSEEAEYDHHRSGHNLHQHRQGHRHTHSHQSPQSSSDHEYQPYEPTLQSRYANICSKLYDATAAAKASMWSNRMPSPPVRRYSAEQLAAIRPPEVESKVTKAQLYNKREKYVKFDSKDVAEIDKKHHQDGSKKSRAASAPVLGRIYVPVYTPIATRAQLVQRFPRVLSPSPRQRHAAASATASSGTSEEMDGNYPPPPVSHIEIPSHIVINGMDNQSNGSSF